MKTPTPEIQIATEETVNGPAMSFSHLSSAFASSDLLSDNSGADYGFPQSREEDLYETGYLSKIFLRC